MVSKFYKIESRKDFYRDTDGDQLTREEIKLGAILRVADAVEKMAENHQRLIEQNQKLVARVDELTRSRNYYKGHFNKLKNTLRSEKRKAKK